MCGKKDVLHLSPLSRKGYSSFLPQYLPKKEELATLWLP